MSDAREVAAPVPMAGSASSGQQKRIVARYPYCDEEGTLLFEVLRYVPKDFRQRRPDGSGGHIWNLDGVRRVPYRLPQLLNTRGVVCVVEGERDVDRLADLGLTATCNPCGAGNWRPEFAEYFKGRDVIVLPDNDGPGLVHADDVARSLCPIAQCVRVVWLPGLPEKGDASDWLDAGHTIAELEGIAAQTPLYSPCEAEAALGESKETKQEPQRERVGFPEFPKEAWRGLFANYRSAMERATEANDAFHFAALWTRCAVELGRRVRFPYGMQLFPNVYLVCFGPTGDRKTTATRMCGEIGGEFKIVRGGGSGEGLADNFSGAKPGHGFLLYAEEFSQILRPGRWDGATLIPFLTQCFDCPPRYEMKFRKSPVGLEQPTPSLLAGATPDWFWQDFRARDFQGGFGNRLFFFTGPRKPAMPLPESPNLDAISRAVDALQAVQPCEARLDAKARVLWDKFYRAWDAEESRRDPLLLVAVKRIPAYILKLAMLYAALEGTLPEMTCDQLRAAILVGWYGEDCAKELLSLQNTGTNPRKELERRILALVGAEPNGIVTKREVYKRLWRHYSDAEAFNRGFDSLVRAGELFTKHEGRGRVLVSREALG